VASVQEVPERTVYHRWMGWHAPALRRVLLAAAIGVTVTVALCFFVNWPFAVIVGWDCTAVLFLGSVWAVLLRANGDTTESLAMREDETRSAAWLLLTGASLASLLAVGFTLNLAGREDATARAVLIGLATVTVTLSWVVVNTLYTLHYARLYYAVAPGGIDFGDSGADPPSYRDFAYVAFTIGMTYQVSDTTVRRSNLRHTALVHALISYVFGVVIVAAGINLIADLIR
jgi:uncharacterized membrane protein